MILPRLWRRPNLKGVRIRLLAVAVARCVLMPVASGWRAERADTDGVPSADAIAEERARVVELSPIVAPEDVKVAVETKGVFVAWTHLKPPPPEPRGIELLQFSGLRPAPDRLTSQAVVAVRQGRAPPPISRDRVPERVPECGPAEKAQDDSDHRGTKYLTHNRTSVITAPAPSTVRAIGGRASGATELRLRGHHGGGSRA